MKHVKWLLALALLALPALAYGQSVVQDGQSFRGVVQQQSMGGILRADSTGMMLTMDSDGNLKTVDTDRDRDYVQTWPLSFTAGLTPALANGAADSITTPLDVHAYGSLKLLLRAHVRTAATSTIRLAIQFREHVNGAVDSTSTYAEYLYTNGPMPSHQDSLAFGVVAGQARFVTTQGADTTQSGHIVTGSLTAPWSGEYCFVFDRAREGPSNGLWAYPNGVSISLDSIFGRPVRFDQLTIRIRNLSTATADVSATLKGFAVR